MEQILYMEYINNFIIILAGILLIIAYSNLVDGNFGTEKNGTPFKNFWNSSLSAKMSSAGLECFWGSKVTSGSW